MNLAANQLFIFSNLKDFNSSTCPLNMNIIITSPCKESFFIVKEVYLGNIQFMFEDYCFNGSYLLSWVKSMKLIIVVETCLAILTIAKGYAEYFSILPPNFCNCEVSNFLKTFIGKFLHVWDTYRKLSLLFLTWNNFLTIDDVLKYDLLCSNLKCSLN